MSLALVSPPELMVVLRDIAEKGGRPYLVGGCVRDFLLGNLPDDYDIEVYDLPDQRLADILRQHGPVQHVGESFGVYLLHHDGHKWDFSLPRRDSAGRKPVVDVDVNMSFEDATARRDFTINAILYDPFNNRYIDPQDGRDDLATGILRAPSHHFLDDPLRPLRGMRFAARFDMEVEPITAGYASYAAALYDKLPHERVWGEWYKWTTQAKKPSAGLRFLVDTNWIKLYPLLDDLRNVEQDPVHHPEGDAFTHTGHVCDAACKIADRECLQGEDRAVLMLTALLHDVGKTCTTVWKSRDGKVPTQTNGKWASGGHAGCGVPLARQFLESIGCLPRIIERVLPLVSEHMYPTWEKQDARMVRRLMVRLQPSTLKELLLVIEADHSGRPPLPQGLPPHAAQIISIASNLPPKIEPIVKGRHLLLQGFRAGPDLGVILRSAFDAQIDGEFMNADDGVKWVLAHYKNASIAE